MLTSKCALRFEPATSKISLSLYSKQLQIPRSPLFGEARTREKMVSFLVEKYMYVCLMKNTIYSGASTKCKAYKQDNLRRSQTFKSFVTIIFMSIYGQFLKFVVWQGNLRFNTIIKLWKNMNNSLQILHFKIFLSKNKKTLKYV